MTHICWFRDLFDDFILYSIIYSMLEGRNVFETNTKILNIRTIDRWIFEHWSHSDLGFRLWAPGVNLFLESIEWIKWQKNQMEM